MPPLNEFGQPIGDALPLWLPRSLPPQRLIQGNYCQLEPINATTHAEELFQAYQLPSSASDWTYLPVGPFETFAQFLSYIQQAQTSLDPLHFAIRSYKSAQAVGSIALMRIDTQHGVAEIGHVIYSAQLKRSAAATEAVYLLLQLLFDELGYRRCEWKCDSLHEKSRAAALRYGFKFEGIFRQAIVYKQRSRDTAWFAMTDKDWPRIKQIFETWLNTDNFDHAQQQRRSMSQITQGL